MIKRDIWNQCEVCGRFVSYDDLDSGRARITAATRLMGWDDYTPVDTLVTLCPAHAAQETEGGEAS